MPNIPGTMRQIKSYNLSDIRFSQFRSTNIVFKTARILEVAVRKNYVPSEYLTLYPNYIAFN